jgi:hypothetical protein
MMLQLGRDLLDAARELIEAVRELAAVLRERERPHVRAIGQGPRCWCGGLHNEGTDG